MTRTPRKEVPTAMPETDFNALLKEVKSALGSQLVILKDVEIWVPTGIPRMDLALGGGFPAGKLSTLIGKKSVGKSTLTVHILKQIQKMMGLAIGLDAERANLRSRCEAQGLNMERYIATQPESLDTFERENFKTGKNEKVKGAFDIMESVLKVVYKKSPDTLMGVVLDSVAGSSVASEIEADVGKAGMGKHARVLSQAFRKVMPMIDEMNVCFILVNQLKEKIGVVYGSPTTYIGKNPIDFHSSITLEMVQGGTFPKSSDEPEGIITKVWVSKNKVYKPFIKFEYVTWFDRGIDTLWEAIDFLQRDCGVFGATSGYLEWEGKKRRQKELYTMAVEDPALGAKFEQMAKEVVDEKLKKYRDSMADIGSKVSGTSAA